MYLKTVTLALALLLVSPTAAGQAVPGGALPGPLPLFPPDNWWNADVSAAPLDPGSTAFINYIGPARGLHPDFGGDSSPFPAIYGFPYIVVSGSQPLVPVVFDYPGESDYGAPGRPPGYPIPEESKTQPKWIEGGFPGNASVGGDKHMLIVDRDNRILYELFDTRFNVASNRWEAGSGAIFPLDSSQRRPDGWTSADAAGLAILPGLVRYDEVSGPDPIRHAFRFTVRATNGYVYPASHRAGSTAGAPPMGMRLRLKASKDISGYAEPVRKIFQAMKTYGLIVADNGSDMYVQGSYDTRWDNNVLNPAFAGLHAGDFEVVQLGWQPPVPPPPGNLSFHTLPPCRVLDTRAASGFPAGYGPPSMPGAKIQRTFVLSGRCGIPAGAEVVSANVTVWAPATRGDLRIFAAGGAAPAGSMLDWEANILALANSGLLQLGAGGAITVQIDGPGTVDVIVDVNGYFQ